MSDPEIIVRIKNLCVTGNIYAALKLTGKLSQPKLMYRTRYLCIKKMNQEQKGLDI